MNRPQDTILIIDDDADMAEMVGVLVERDFRAVVHTSPTAGLLAAYDEPPAAIVLDLAMPGLGGWDVLESLRSNAKTADIPIVIMTAVTDDAVRRRAEEMGCAFVRKPFECDELLAVLAEHSTASEDP